MIKDAASITNGLNDFFVHIGFSLSEKNPSSSEYFVAYLKRYNSRMEEYNLTMAELNTAFNTLQSNKSAGIDEISVNVVKNVFDLIKLPLFYVFNLSLTEGIIPEKLKIARITPIFNSGDRTNLTNYRAISVLPCFSKILERIMYNRID
ncbi:uncharacterized protein LOC130648249 [Hydractinia symbiolongicarpus]|uniref:uncharacterized protein LOC130648249 n=1 Tax=Hydractinia symbiolongicarpus TaxID=13093 RepID=UPI002549F934|nr:uncharacterized protein LOC130648249 [Hydractinia symbiolongicarpus]